MRTVFQCLGQISPIFRKNPGIYVEKSHNLSTKSRLLHIVSTRRGIYNKFIRISNIIFKHEGGVYVSNIL